MSDIKDQIITLYIKHNAWMTDGGLIECACDDGKNLTISEHAKHFADVMVSELGLSRSTTSTFEGEFEFWATRPQFVEWASR
jgi:hypothetical protein